MTVHAETGERVLFVSPSFLKSVAGFTPRESAKILELLWEHSVRPEYTVRFKWNPGDIAFWDNRSTSHLAPTRHFPIRLRPPVVSHHAGGRAAGRRRWQAVPVDRGYADPIGGGGTAHDGGGVAPGPSHSEPDAGNATPASRLLAWDQTYPDRSRIDPQGAPNVRFGFYLPTRGPTATREGVLALAREGERLGLHSAMIADHIVFPTESESVYPSRWIAGVPAPATHSNLLHPRRGGGRDGEAAPCHLRADLPYRNPVLTAKMVASLDVLSGGRVTLGIGVGWLREEFEALDGPDSAAAAPSRMNGSLCYSNSSGASRPPASSAGTIVYSDIRAEPFPCSTVPADVAAITAPHSSFRATR